MRLHHKTVTSFSVNQKQFIFGKKNYSGPDRRKVPRMKRTQIDPFLWELALFASGGDVSRIEIVSELEIVVHNNDTWKKKGRKDNG